MHKISVISRGQALGYTISMPSEDTYLTTRSQLRDQLAMTLGGRAAEELVFDEVTTGAANDLEKVTATAKNMIMRYGMSEKLGPRTLGRTHDQPFLGREFSQEPDYSEEIAREIDDEIRRIVEEAHERARDRARRARRGAAPHLEDPGRARDDRPRRSSCACSTARPRRASSPIPRRLRRRQTERTPPRGAGPRRSGLLPLPETLSKPAEPDPGSA